MRVGVTLSRGGGRSNADNGSDWGMATIHHPLCQALSTGFSPLLYSGPVAQVGHGP